jgi:hypothetical protein
MGNTKHQNTALPPRSTGGKGLTSRMLAQQPGPFRSPPPLPSVQGSPGLGSLLHHQLWDVDSVFNPISSQLQLSVVPHSCVLLSLSVLFAYTNNFFLLTVILEGKKEKL